MAATKYLDYDGLLYFWTLIKAKLVLKADAHSVTPGSYGPSADASPAHSGTFKVPTIQVSSQGVITAISEKTITLPSDNNTDTLVTQNASTANEEHPILLTVTKDATNNQGAKTSIFAAGVKVNPSTGTVTAAKFKGVVEGKADSAIKLDPGANINGTLFTGESAITTSKWGTARNISISDSDGTNTGTAISVDGSAAKTLKLPATIKATLTGNASTATNVAWSGVTSKPNTISGYGINDAYTKTEIDNKLSSAVNYKGSVATYNDLPNNPTAGDMYNITATDENYIWAAATGTQGQSGYVAAHWDPVGALVNIEAITNSEIDTVVAS